MKIIVPMAGIGKRMRPHTLTVPKPLLPIAGKPIVQRLVEEIAKVCGEQIEEIAYVIGDFGKETEEQLINVAENLGAKGRIYYQDEALGTAHAILCARESLKGNIVIAFADTLFKADFTINTSYDGVIWVKKIDDPSSFGVIKVNEQNIITDFVEKPKGFVSDLAIIGIYYFKDGAMLRKELQYLIDNNIKDKGEFQLTNALENMKQKGACFVPGTVQEWLDCGNKESTLNSNKRILELDKDAYSIAPDTKLIRSVIIQPCCIGQGVIIENAVIGPYVSIGDHSILTNTIIENSIIQMHTSLKDANIINSIIGNHVHYKGNKKELSIGDYSREE